MRARDVMTKRVVTVRPGTPVTQARQLLTANRFSALPVVDDRQRLVGILSSVDLLRARLNGAAPRTVGEVMSRDVIYLSPGSGLGVLAHRLRTYGELRVMPIVDQGMLAGVVTRGDLLRQPRDRGAARLARRLREFVRRPEPEPLIQFTPVEVTPEPSSGDARAGDVMTSSGLVTVTMSTPVERAAELLTGQRFTALPVVDGHQRLVGILSEADIIDDPLDGRRTGRPRTVGAAMTEDVAALAPDAPIRELYGLLAQRGFRLVPIVEGDTVVGVVSRGDLLRRTSGPDSAAARGD
ncbi:MAG TPA: CBS domain-containing protein [Pseudonocardia sp.]|jgi:CBS domain-containing protein